MNKTLLSILIFITCSSAIGQSFPSKNYPQGYFRNPLGIPLQLSANFGELRTNHFHMGLDIRTAQKENLPVYAAAEGYISRVKIERYGFGRAIYITHPNGYTTLYAHLNDFFPGLHQAVITKQYADEQWEQDINFTPEQFPVGKGQFIAYSGNTGGSAGPHLHFEIRDTKTENLYNPWLFNFGLADNIPPYLYNVYYYDRRYSTYQVGPTPIRIRGSAGVYKSVDSVVILPTPTISFGISAEDKTNVSPFKFGIYQAEVWVDDTLLTGFQLDNFSYGDSRYINASIDYRTKLNGGPYIQHLGRLPGNNLPVFTQAKNDGVYIMQDTAVHSASIIVKDAAGNTSNLSFNFKYDPAKNTERVFATNYVSMLPNQENLYEAEDISVWFTSKAFYHQVPFVHASQLASNSLIVSAVHQLHNTTVPVHDSFTVSLKPNGQLENNLRDKVVMQLVTPKKKVAAKGIWQGDKLQAKFWDFGTVKLILDTVPPTITPLGFKTGSNFRTKKAVQFVVKDDVGEIKSFKATIDGKWLLFSRKDYTFTHQFDERTTAGSHELKVIVTDEAGNITERNYSITR